MRLFEPEVIVNSKRRKPLSPSLTIPINHLRTALRAVFPGRGASSRRSPTILVVDDEPLIVQGLAAILNSEGFTVLTAFDAQSALKLVQKTSPELLISDVSMPGMDGIELAMRLVTALPSLKVMLFTAHFEDLKVNFQNQEENHFSLLSKPVPPQQMLNKVRATLEGVRTSKPHHTLTEDDDLLVGSRPRTNRRTSLPAPPEKSSTIDAQIPHPSEQSVDARLSDRRHFLKTADGRTSLPPSKTDRPSFFEKSALPKMSRGTPATTPLLPSPPAAR